MRYVRAGLELAVVLALGSAAGSARAQNIYAPNANPAEVYAFERAWQAEHAGRFDSGAGWSNAGTAALVNVSFMKDGVPVTAPASAGGGVSNNVLFASLDSQFAGVGGRARWQTVIGTPTTSASDTSAFGDGACALWDSPFTGSNLNMLFRRRADKGGIGDDVAVNNWDDGTAFGTAGPIGPTTPTAVTITMGGGLTSANFAVNGSASTLVITTVPAGAGPFTIDLTAAANDTLTELAATISGIAGLTATLDPQITPATSSITLNGSQNFTLTAAANTNSLKIPVARGDIRICMRPLPAAILAAVNAPADGGDIILNSTVDWTTTTGTLPFVTLENTVARALGIALGLKFVCPSDGTKLMEQTLVTDFIGPQHDEYRGIHFLYGDRNEPNDTAALAGSQGASKQIPSPSGTLANDEHDKFRMSLRTATDIDLYKMIVPSNGKFDFTIVAQPEGATYKTGPVDANCSGVTFNSLAAMDIRLSVFDDTGKAIFDNAPIEAAPPYSVYSNLVPAGRPETLTARIINNSASNKTVYVAVSPDPAGTSAVQLYHLLVKAKNLAANIGNSLGPIVTLHADTGLTSQQTTNAGPTGHGALSFEFDSALFGNDPDYPPIPLTAYNNNYSGLRAVLANVDGGFPDPNHVVFGNRVIQQLQWKGVNPATSTINDHATSVTGPAVGVQIGSGDTFFRGVAPAAKTVGVDIATAIAPSGRFTTSTESLFYGLFAAADPTIAAQAGLTRPATVISAAWGAYTDLTGDGMQPRAFDAVVNQTNVTAVVAAGNDGLADNTPNCSQGSPPQELPGVLFFGSRTINSPATAFNVISVGAATKTFDVPVPPPPGGGGGGGGGGGRPGSPDPTRDAENGKPFDTIPQFSSKGPIDSTNFDATDTNFTRTNARPGVHILAAGAGLSPRMYDPSLDTTSGVDPCVIYGQGHYPPSKPLIVPQYDATVNDNFQGAFGTSFSAAIVAGAVALLQDFGLAQSPAQSIDALVMKSVLLTGAIKMSGWTNTGFPAKPQDNRDGRDAFDPGLISGFAGPGAGSNGTSSCLDFAQGAGVLSIPNSFAIYAKGDLKDSPLTDPKVPTYMKLPTTTITSSGRPGSPSTSTPPSPLPEANLLDPNAHPIRTPLEISRIVASMDRLEEGSVMSPLRRQTLTDAGGTDPVLGTGGGGTKGATIFPTRTGVFTAGGALPPVFGGGTSGSGGTGGGGSKVLTTPIEGGSVGWDIGMIGTTSIPSSDGSASTKGGYIDYRIDIDPVVLSNGNTVNAPFLDATLVWNRNVQVNKQSFDKLDNPQAGQLNTYELEDLSLELYKVLDPITDKLSGVQGMSDTKFNNIEHLHWPVPIGGGGSYILRVRWIGQDYDLFNNVTSGRVKYAVAWANNYQLPYRLADGLPAPALPRLTGLPALGRVLSLFGKTAGQAGYDALADYNQDGVINSTDLAWVLTYWPSSNAGTTASN